MKQLSRGLLSSVLLHVADVSNPARPGSIARKWACVVQAEFFRQGDKEKELNLPRSPFMDREYENLPRMQGAFIDAIVAPVFGLLGEFLPQVTEECIKSLQSNRAFWDNMEKKGIVASRDITAFLEKDVRSAASVEGNSRNSSGGGSNEDEDDNPGANKILVPVIHIDKPIPGIPPNAPMHATQAEPVRRDSFISLHNSSRNCNLNDMDPELGEGRDGGSKSFDANEWGNSIHLSGPKVVCSTSIKARLTTLLQSHAFQACMMLATLYALFAPDLNMAVGNKQTDKAVDAISFIVLLLFLGEMGASIFCIPRYMQFFFWLDLAATVSLVLEIGFLFQVTLPTTTAGSTDQLSLAKASRAARIGARAARLSSLLRLVRLIRVAKAVKWMMSFIRRKNVTRSKDGDDHTEDVQLKMSVVGQRMTESITKKVIIAVLLTLVVFSLMDANLTPDARQVQIDGLSLAVTNEEGTVPILRRAFFDSYDNILMLKGVGGDFIQEGRIEHLRANEMLSVQATYPTNSTIAAIFDVSKESEISAWYSFGTTVIVTVLLAVLSLLMNRDAYRIIIRPVVQMKATITQLATNPLLHLEKTNQGSKNSRRTSETDMLEVAIGKMGTLLQIGFGTAGAEIIAKSLSDGGELDPMLPGSRVNAIFGFIDIRDFTYATEFLQQDVMIFVNKIAELTHRHVVASGGSPNKNIGDAFLLVWKLSSSRSRLQKELFDAALFSVQQITLEIDKFVDLASFLEGETKDENPPWKETLRDFKISMGIGLHTGWAIEGAIGSKTKIDASYLSPHVNLASRLEAATKRYRVPLLMSESFVSNLTGPMQKCCRKVDRVTFKGSSEPMTIYHFDGRPYDEDSSAAMTKPTNYAVLMQATSWKDGAEIRHSGVNITEVRRAFDSGKSLDVRDVYEDVFNAYTDGKWHRCKVLCRLWLERFPGDILVHNLVEYMAQDSFECPSTWSGYHALAEK